MMKYNDKFLINSNMGKSNNLETLAYKKFATTHSKDYGALYFPIWMRNKYNPDKDLLFIFLNGTFLLPGRDIAIQLYSKGYVYKKADGSNHKKGETITFYWFKNVFLPSETDNDSSTRFENNSIRLNKLIELIGKDINNGEIGLDENGKIPSSLFNMSDIEYSQIKDLALSKVLILIAKHTQDSITSTTLNHTKKIDKHKKYEYINGFPLETSTGSKQISIYNNNKIDINIGDYINGSKVNTVTTDKQEVKIGATSTNFKIIDGIPDSTQIEYFDGQYAVGINLSYSPIEVYGINPFTKKFELLLKLGNTKKMDYRLQAIRNNNKLYISTFTNDRVNNKKESYLYSIDLNTLEQKSIKLSNNFYNTERPALALSKEKNTIYVLYSEQEINSSYYRGTVYKITLGYNSKMILDDSEIKSFLIGSSSYNFKNYDILCDASYDKNAYISYYQYGTNMSQIRFAHLNYSDDIIDVEVKSSQSIGSTHPSSKNTVKQTRVLTSRNSVAILWIGDSSYSGGKLCLNGMVRSKATTTWSLLNPDMMMGKQHIIIENNIDDVCSEISKYNSDNLNIIVANKDTNNLEKYSIDLYRKKIAKVKEYTTGYIINTSSSTFPNSSNRLTAIDSGSSGVSFSFTWRSKSGSGSEYSIYEDYSIYINQLRCSTDDVISYEYNVPVEIEHLEKFLLLDDRRYLSKTCLILGSKNYRKIKIANSKQNTNTLEVYGRVYKGDKMYFNGEEYKVKDIEVI